MSCTPDRRQPITGIPSSSIFEFCRFILLGDTVLSCPQESLFYPASVSQSPWGQGKGRGPSLSFNLGRLRGLFFGRIRGWGANLIYQPEKPVNLSLRGQLRASAVIASLPSAFTHCWNPEKVK